MGVSPGDEPVPGQRVEESPDGVVRCTWWHHVAHQPRKLARAGASFVLVLARRVDTHGLRHVLLVNADQPPVCLAPVITIDHDRALLAELRDPRTGNDESGTSSGIQTEMLVEIMVVQARYGRLEDVARGSRA